MSTCPNSGPTVCPTVSFSKEFSARDYDLFVGLDVDKRSIAATIVDHGVLRHSFKMPYDATNILNHIRRHHDGKRVLFAYEAGPTGFGLYDALRSAGEHCLVVSPQSVPRPRDAKVKTNRLDSVMIAKALRGAEVGGIRVPDGIYRDLRHLAALRNQYTREAQGQMYRVKALLLLEGLSFPKAPAGSQWSRRVIAELRELPCRASIRFKLDALLDSLLFARQQKLRAHQQLKALIAGDSDLSDSVRYLRSIPGIGWIIAYNVLARVGDWRVLKAANNVREIGAFLGLVPAENSTGDRTDRGNITRSGDPQLRNMLIEGAWSAIMKDEELRQFFIRVANRHPKDRASRIAIVAVARKLTHRIYAVLTERREYVVKTKEQPTPVSTDTSAEAA